MSRIKAMLFSKHTIHIENVYTSVNTRSQKKKNKNILIIFSKFQINVLPLKSINSVNIMLLCYR